MSAPSFALSGRLRSFKFAARGLWRMLCTQHNAWIHAAATAAAVGAGFWFRLGAAEWCWVVLATASVWSAEAMNTAFEFLADAAIPEFHPLIERAKDVAAAAVLLTACGAAIVGALVFWPHVAALW